MSLEGGLYEPEKRKYMNQALRSLLWLVVILAAGALVIYWDQGHRLQNFDGASLGTPVSGERDPYKDLK